MGGTPNHRYNLPSEGTTDWHNFLNENFEEIDSDIEIRDKETNKGEYKPKDGAKYEATDSGAIYLGDGTSWVLADREVSSLQAENLNGVVTPNGKTIDAFRDAVRRGNCIRLKPGTTYSWDETFVFDPGENDSLIVDARGATIDHNADPAVDILVSEHISGTTDIEWIGGHFRGPGADAGSSVAPRGVPSDAPKIADGTSAFRITDSFGHTVKPETVENVRSAVYIRNLNYWSESLEIGGGCDPSSVDYFVLALGGQFLGTDGGNSMRNIKIESGWGDSRGGHVTIYQGAAGFHGGEIIHRGNVSDDGWGWFSQGNLTGTRIQWESEFGNENSTAIEFAGTAGTPPPFNARPNNNGDGVVSSRPGTILYWDGHMLRDAQGQKGVNITFNRPEWVWEGDTSLTAGGFISKNPLTDLSNDRGLDHTELTYFSGDEENSPGWYWWDKDGDTGSTNEWNRVGDPVAHDSGRTSLSQGEEKVISQSGSYKTGYYSHATRGTASGSGRVNVIFDNNGTGDPQFIAREVSGAGNLSFEWMIYKVA